MVFHPSKETLFCLFYNGFPSFVCVSFLTACSLSSRCASRGQIDWSCSGARIGSRDGMTGLFIVSDPAFSKVW